MTQNRGKKKARQTRLFNSFKGVDYAHTPANVAPERCVNGLNMVRSEVGKVQKRTGYEYDSRVWMDKVNGVHFLVKDSGRICLMHCGTGFYVDGVKIYEGTNYDFSHSVQMGDVLYILDGLHFLMFDGKTVADVRSSAYVPTVCINRTPSGGGKKYEQVNILTAKRREGFIADGESKEYILSVPSISADGVTAVVYKDDGSFYTATTGAGLTVDAVNGMVRFDTAPPLSKVTDTDNVYITYEKGTAEGGNVLNKCTVMAAFGAGGKPDTLFLSGNPDYPGREWFSQPENPGFFGEQNTDIALDNGSSITGYSVRGDKLFVHRKNGERNLNILVRTCSGGDKNLYSYPVVNALTGPGAIAAGSFVNMANDALFLSENGVFAITEADADERHFAQIRSFYINPSLTAHENLQRAQAVSFNDFYVLSTGRNIYLLDTLQKSYEEDKEYSSYQYEGYHWQIPDEIRLLFVEKNRLCFVTENGRIGRFFTDYSSPDNFNDAGAPINAVWQTGDFYGESKVKIKNIHYLWLVCAAANYTSVDVSAQIKGIWKRLFSDSTTARFFQWSKLNWAKFTWSTDKTPKLISRAVRIKNVDKVAVRLENNILNEPFGIYELGMEYTEGSFYR